MIKPLQTLKKFQQYIPAMSQLTTGNSWDIADGDLQQLESFTCAIYGKAHSSSLDFVVRSIRISDFIT